MAARLATIVTISDYTAFDDFDGAVAVLSGLGDYDGSAYRYSGIAPPAGAVDLAYLRNVLSPVPRLGYERRRLAR